MVTSPLVYSGTSVMENGPAGTISECSNRPFCVSVTLDGPFAMPLNTGVYPRLPGFMLLFRLSDTPYVPVLPSRLSPVDVFPTARSALSARIARVAVNMFIVAELSPLSPPLAVAEELTTQRPILAFRSAEPKAEVLLRPVLAFAL